MQSFLVPVYVLPRPNRARPSTPLFPPLNRAPSSKFFVDSTDKLLYVYYLYVQSLHNDTDDQLPSSLLSTFWHHMQPHSTIAWEEDDRAIGIDMVPVDEQHPSYHGSEYVTLTSGRDIQRNEHVLPWQGIEQPPLQENDVVVLFRLADGRVAWMLVWPTGGVQADENSAIMSKEKEVDPDIALQETRRVAHRVRAWIGDRLRAEHEPEMTSAVQYVLHVRNPVTFTPIRSYGLQTIPRHVIIPAQRRLR